MNSSKMSDKSEKKELTPQEKLKVELQMESDLGRLQKQYQTLERDSHNISRSAGGKLSKLAQVVSISTKEQCDILMDLTVAASESNIKKDLRIIARLNGLLSEHDQFRALIKQEKGHLSEIESQISMVNKQVVIFKSKQITSVQCQKRVLDGQRILDALENKLDTAIKRFCVILAENTKLRTEIDHYLKERAHFKMLWDKLITNLAQGKKYMIDLIEQATIAYDEREEWVQKLHALRNRARTDVISHTLEMRELERKKDNDKKLELFLSTKGQKRVMHDMEQRYRKKREQQQKELCKQLASYKTTLENIQEFTNETDIGVVASNFIKQEEENFAVFLYITELNREMEVLTDELGALHGKIDEQKQLREHRAIQQKKTLDKLAVVVEQKRAEVQELENDLHKSGTTLDKLTNNINKLFTLCRCNGAPFLELLGNNTKINNYNVLFYLEILEQRVDELIMNANYNEVSSSDTGEKIEKRPKKVKENIIREEITKYIIPTLDDVVYSNPCPLCVEQEQVSDVIDTLQFVLDRDEITNRLRSHLKLADAADVIHNVSACHLPKSREIIQRRYQ